MLPRHAYIHVPFCRRRCSYCDFAIAVRSTVPAAEFADAISRELSVRFTDHGHWTVDTLYLGGGTPSRLGPPGVEQLMAVLAERIELAAGAEVTLEANPEDVTPDAVQVWRNAGINRVSLGAQSFDDRVLAWMHRTHSADQTRAAVRALREAGFHNWSLDLIFALPPELDRDWRRDLETVRELDPAHVSLYGLTIEPHTPVARWLERGVTGECVEERYEEEFLAANYELASLGFEHYEVSNFARSGMRSRHNSGYWSGTSYVGLGPSAHGFDGAARRWNDPVYTRWLSRLTKGEDPLAGSENLSPENRSAELVYLGLRTTAGLETTEAEAPAIDRWVDSGWAAVQGDRVTLTPLGWLRLDALAVSLTSLRSP